MASKLQTVSALADQTAQNITRNVEGWKSYLTTAARLYKYPFDEQLLIYAQRPNATACADMELWNDTMRRWVRAGSKGIAVIRKNDGGRPHLEYVFDVADTRPLKGARTPWLWELREEHHSGVLAALGRRYGETEQAGIGNQLMEMASRAVEEVYRDHLRDLAYDVRDSFLEELDDLNLEVRFRSILTASVQYTLLSRCGIDPADYLEDDDLWGITEFTTPAVLHHLGSAVSGLSMDLLMEIGKEIRRYERAQQQSRQNSPEKTIAKADVIGYTKDRREFSALNRESTERSGQHDGTDIQQGGRLPDPRPDDGRGDGGGPAPGQVRDAAGDLLAGAAPRDVHLHAADGQAGETPAGDRPAGPGAGGQDGGRDDAARGRDRGDEGQRPDGVGTGGEQLHGPGGGNGAGGDRLPVNQENEQAAGDEPAAFASPKAALRQFSLFPTVEEQVERITQAQAEEQQAPLFTGRSVLPVPDAVVGRALTGGGNSPHSVERIVAFFQKGPTGSAAASFLQEEYGEGGRGVFIGGKEYALWFSQEGFHIAPGKTVQVPGCTIVPWVQAAAQVSRLLQDGMYASQEKLDGARGNEYRELSEQLWYLRREFSEEAREMGFLQSMSDAYKGNGFPESTAQIAELLRNPEARHAIRDELDGFTQAYERDRGLLRFRPSRHPRKLLAQISDLDKPLRPYPAAMDGFTPASGTFITQDEIDRVLARGSNVSEGKLRIYAYFMQGHNARECVDFLKNEYGIGGQGFSGFDEWHDGKGIKIARADDFSQGNYDTVQLNWSQVEKRIRSLMDSGRYLNEREQAYLPEYEKKQLARRIYAFQYHNPNQPGRTYPHTWDFAAAERDILPMLDDPAAVDSLFNRMLGDFAPLPPDTPRYDVMQAAIRDLAAYQRGEFSLFKPLPETVLQAERQAKEAKKEASRTDAPKEKAPEDELAAAARALARKQRTKTRESEDGQLSFDFLSMQAPAKEPAPPPVEAAEPAPPKKTVVEVILSPDLDRERREKDAARKEASEVLEGRGFPTDKRTLDSAMAALGRDATHADRIIEQVETEVLARYDIGCGHLGNGLTVWNRLEEVDGDYKTIAHIAPDRSVTFYDQNLPEPIRERIREMAATTEMTISATQDAPVFSTPPQTREPAPEVAEPEPAGVGDAVPPEPDTTPESTGAGAPQAQEPPRQRPGRSRPEVNYRTFEKLFPEVASGEYRYLQMQAGESFMPLHLQWIGENTVAVSHTYQLGGDLAYDPEITFRIDREAGKLEPLTFRQDNLGLYQEVYPQPGRWIPRLHHELSAFTATWLQNIQDQGYVKEQATVLRDGEEVSVSFDPSGAELPAPEVAEPEPAEAGDAIPPEPDATPEATGAGAPERTESETNAPSEPDLTPNVEEYLRLKAEYPDKLIGVQVGGHILFYGKDAQEAAPALGTNLLTREIDGLGETAVTGSSHAWQATLKRLLEHGKSVVLARPDAERGPDAPYEIIKERDAAEYIPIGMELTIDGRRMKIDSVDYERGEVSLQDMEMRGWFPIFRSENVPFVREYVEEAQEQQWAQEMEQEGLAAVPDAPGEPAAEPVELDGGKISAPRVTKETLIRSPRLPYDIVIQTLSTEPERHNFRITDDNLGVGGEKTKYHNNVAAIRALKQIEAEGRLATPEEQETLSRYVGWGGIAQAFDPDNPRWEKEYAELKDLLTPEEYESARSTVLNAHYTSPTVIKAIYQAVEGMDFTPGTVLEPSMGIGNFFGLVPEKLAGAKLYGVELDDLTGRIAKQLYQKADITVDGFENTDHPDDFFDLAVGNVPFGEYKVHDRRYDRQNLLIHDYFITKTLDKVRPGGIVAFITSKGTMDKQNSKVRQALAQKADLLGAIRLPNNAFKANAGTEVTTDILFFQKRDRIPEREPEWVQLGQTEDGVPLNRYFQEHPEMVLGKMAFFKGMYGNGTETGCLPIEGADLSQQLAGAIRHITPPNRELLAMDAPEQEAGTEARSIPADPTVRNFSYALVGGQVYFRENSRMKPVELGKTPTQRVKGMVAIRDCARNLIDLQLNGADDAQVQAEQARLNTLYDQFTAKYGLLNSAGNRLAFRQDASYPLLCSLEVLNDEGELERKADMFTKRTIQNHKPVTSVDTAAEALAVSIGERACVDLGFMASLMGDTGSIPQIVEDLKGVIFKDPATGPFDMEEGGTHWHQGWQTADEYLSGNVREKLASARDAAERHPEFAVNVAALEQVQPKELTAAEIDVRVGAPWVPVHYYKQFMFELLQTPHRLRHGKVDILYSKSTGEWNIKGKSEDSRDNARAWATYGTKRRSAYMLLEDALNLRDTRVYDTRYEDGKEIRVLNPKETAIAQQKQEAICQAFRDWIFKDPERRANLCAIYNRIFNSTRPREYNGEHVRFTGMNPEIRLEPHQRNAVARMLYGGNALLAHCVGAGKTFEMTAAAMESKRLGLCQKSLFVVPNHLTEQWGGDFLTLYPGAKVLVATKQDFEPANRRKFCARIATGDYDAVIIGHSQFEKIPLSPERQRAVIEGQIDEIVDAIQEAKSSKAENFTIKQLERTRKNLEAKLKRLFDKKKDDTVTFEELGVDRLFVDEAHYYKNLFMHTKMRNVAGISQTEAQKSSDMFAKCRYLDEITGGKGVTFATGTPVSNSMVELYTMMRYLQYDMLEQHGLQHFDSWAADFGEKVTAVELKPEGTGFRAKTRFARFFNLPELMNLWKEAADIQTADMLKLPVPEAEYITISTEPSEAQKQMVQDLAERAEAVRKGDVDPTVDNMLRITSDGRKLALDQRLANPLLGDDPDSKVNACVNNVFQVWEESAATRGAQLIFSDLSTPKGRQAARTESGTEEAEAPEDAQAAAMEASVYEDIRDKLIAKGVPRHEIAFIHDAHTDAQKAELFAKVRAGQVRVLLGSTQKMGAGTNVQTRLVASHDLDCPWRPADLEQRAGRILRRGNENEKVKIFRYVTKGTFDAYNWGLVENKQKFIGQIMTSKSPARSIEDVDATALSYAEVKMIATGDPRIKEKMDLDIQVAKLKLLRSNHMAQKYEMEDKVIGYYPRKMAETNLFIEALGADLPTLQAHPVKEDAFSMTVMGQTYTERKAAGEAIIAACKSMTDPDKPLDLGEYRGFPMQLQFDGAQFKVTMKQHLTYTAELSGEVVGNVTRINNALERIPENLERQRQHLITLQNELESAKEEAARPFPQEEELAVKSARLNELNAELDNEERGGGEQPAQEDGGEPARDAEKPPAAEDRKPSIRAALRSFERPAPAAAGVDRSQRREAAL